MELNAIIITFDKDYGEIIYKTKIVEIPSVVFFRHKTYDPEFAAKTLLEILKKKEISLTNYFTIVEENSIRQRKLINE